MSKALAVCRALALATLLMISATAHAESPLNNPSTSEITVKDWRDKEITLPEVPDKIVSLTSPSTIILYALGAGDKVIGVDKYSIDYVKESLSAFKGSPGNQSYYEKLCEEVPNEPNLGSSWTPSIEMIVGLEPDVVFMYYYKGTEENIVKLEERGLTVIAIGAKNFDDTRNLIILIGKVVDKESEVDKLIDEIELRLGKVSESVKDLPRPRVYHELTSHLTTAGGDTFTHQIIETAGGDNVFKNLTGFPVVSKEAIIKANPDIIIFSSTNSIAKRALDEARDIVDVLLEEESWWGEIDAVKNRRVYIIPTYYETYDQRFVIGVELMAKWFHPTVFGIEGHFEKPLPYIGPGKNDTIDIAGLILTHITFIAPYDKDINMTVMSIEQISLDVSLSPWGATLLNVPGFRAYTYKYLEIRLTPPADVSESRLNFCVERSWLDGYGINETAVALFRWNGASQSWDKLSTNVIEANGTHVFYETESIGLSLFAIAGLEALSAPPIWEQLWVWGLAIAVMVLAAVVVLRYRVIRRRLVVEAKEA
ncbi:MAG: ABC transporter substrate-binding protein [archaeon]|nr:ABC transporter substrate-binding protein [archaeon]MCP8315105.1 ABC transporter substrate-binding protein [archaeon]MCP8319384.1 ABC transporter substrate-binding protein [archaeon]